jgi:hypothetical protein
MLWQAASGMYFRMAEGYVTFAPPARAPLHSRWPIVGFINLEACPRLAIRSKHTWLITVSGR